VLCRLFCALLFVAWTAERPVADDQILYCGLWRSPFQVLGPLFAIVPVVSQPVWRILVFLTAPIVFLRPGAFRQRPWILDGALLVSALSIGVTFAWGVSRGGSPYQAYFQLNAFLTALLVAWLLTAVIRTPRHLKMLGITIVSAAIVRGTLATYFYLFHVRGRALDPFPQYMTTHDDSVLFTAGLLTLISWSLVRGRLKTWLFSAPAIGILLVAIVVNNRRLAWIELLLGLAVLYRLLPSGRVRWRINLLALLLTPVVLLYVAVGWGRQGPLFAPVRAMSTTGSSEDNSSLARHEENANLTQTLRVAGNPLFGTGWGRPYEKITSWYANFGAEWSQYLYLPHNSLLGIAVFGGLTGLFGIWLVVPVTALLASGGYHGASQAIERAAAMTAIAILPAYAAQCFGDIGFQSFTCGMILSVAMAAAGKTYAWAGPPRSAPRKVGGRQQDAPVDPTPLGAA
jgi:hypothetical protein